MTYPGPQSKSEQKWELEPCHCLLRGNPSGVQQVSTHPCLAKGPDDQWRRGGSLWACTWGWQGLKTQKAAQFPPHSSENESHSQPRWGQPWRPPGPRVVVPPHPSKDSPWAPWLARINPFSAFFFFFFSFSPNISFLKKKKNYKIQ